MKKNINISGNSWKCSKPLIWPPVNCVDGCTVYRKLHNSYKSDKLDKLASEKSSQFFVFLSDLFILTRIQWEAFQMDCKKMHHRREQFCCYVIRQYFLYPKNADNIKIRRCLRKRPHISLPEYSKYEIPNRIVFLLFDVNRVKTHLDHIWNVSIMTW